MPKTIWVVLPLVLFGSWVGARVAMGRRPSRLALNVVSSLLLLLYVATTAGLGIFWVANQQLPVFDWHYLFGYCTAALVVLHLSFNLRVVLGYFRRRKREAEPVAERALWPSAAAALLVGAAGFALGLRHGESVLHVSWPGAATAGAGSAEAGDVIERFHAFSSHSRLSVLARAPIVEWGGPPSPFKSYSEAPRLALPEPARGGRPTEVALSTRAPAEGTRLALAGLATILHSGAGITLSDSGFQLRASPSSGALFPAELYVVARDVGGLPAGLYHYDPRGHALEKLPGGRLSAEDLGAPEDPAVAAASAVVVVSAVFRRSGIKYRDRAYRYVAADVGHLLENLRVAAGEIGAEGVFPTPFDEARLAGSIGLDDAEEGAMALFALLPPGARSPPRSERAAVEGETADRRYGPAPPPTGGLAALGATALVHRATSFRIASGRRKEALTPTDLPPSRAVQAVSAPPAPLPALDSIARRRSRRRFSRDPLPLAELSALLRAATAAGPIYSETVRLYVVANRVTGLEPGSYRFEARESRLVPVRLGDLAAEAGASALSQDVIGTAAAVLLSTFDRESLRKGGPREYRLAFFEAGMMAERVYLAGEARGLGVCSVGAFYDDEAAGLVGPWRHREWVAHFQAIGRL